MNTEKLVMEMLGFGCPSCVYTIEKMGRKIPEIEKISASLADQRIYIEHRGSHEDIVRQITTIVNRIGHEVREMPSPTTA